MAGAGGSNNKYSLVSAMRAAAQAISYEVPLVLVMGTVALWAGSISTKQIVEGQQGMWYIAPLFVGFIIFLICSLAEINRIPFDIPQAEGELVAGADLAYFGMRFAFFFMGEFAHLLFMAGLHDHPVSGRMAFLAF